MLVVLWLRVVIHERVAFGLDWKHMIRGGWEREPKIHSEMAGEGDTGSSEHGSRPQ